MVLKGVLIILPVPALMAAAVPLVVELLMIKGVVVPPLWRIVTFPSRAPLCPALQILTVIQVPAKELPFKRTRFPVVGSVPASIVTLPLVLFTPLPDENVAPSVIPPPLEIRLTAPPSPVELALPVGLPVGLAVEFIALTVIPPPVEEMLTAPPLPVRLAVENIDLDVILPPVEERLTAPPLPELESEYTAFIVIFPPVEEMSTAPPLIFDTPVG